MQLYSFIHGLKAAAAPHLSRLCARSFLGLESGSCLWDIVDVLNLIWRERTAYARALL